MGKLNQNMIETTETAQVSCDGGGGELGHPKIYLEIAPDKSSVTCPYCSHKFILQQNG